MAKPVFVVSLDLEMGWGFVLYPRHKVLRTLRNDPQHGRGVIKSLLDLLQKYSIPATWVVVGHLFLGQGEGKRQISPELPQFKEGWIDWDFYSQICDSPLYAAPDVINQIVASPVTHEIGLHSFFHIPFSRCSEAVARREVELAVDSAQKWGIKPHSFVFPGNEVGYLNILASHGIEIYRGRDASSTIRKVIAPPVVPLWKGVIWEIAGSMYFCDPQMPFTLLPRAKIGLERAIRTNMVFHIWLHPWSLLQRKSLSRDLGKFLAFVAQKRDEGNLQVMTMGKLASSLNQNKRGSAC